MNGTLRPSIGRALGLRLFSIFIALTHFGFGVGLVLVINALIAKGDPGKPRTELGAGNKVSEIRSGPDDPAKKLDPGHVEQPKSAMQKFSDAVPTPDPIPSILHTLDKVNEVPGIKIPDDPFAYLVQILLDRTQDTPEAYNTLEKCLKAISRDQLNRPIGTIYWLDRVMHTNDPGPKGENRSTTGPTYNVLFWPPDSGSKPSNSYGEEATVLTLAKVGNIPALIHAGADPDLHFGEKGDTALHFAARHNDVARIKALLDNHADKSLSNFDGGPAYYPADAVPDHLGTGNEAYHLLKRS